MGLFSTTRAKCSSPVIPGYASTRPAKLEERRRKYADPEFIGPQLPIHNGFRGRAFARPGMTAARRGPGAREPSGMTAKHPVNPAKQKYIAFPNFGFVAYIRHPGPARGALRDRHEMRAGVRWTRQRRRGNAVTGTARPLSCARRGYDTAIVTAARLIVGGAHIGPRREGLAVRGRRSRVVLTAGRCRQVSR